MQRTLALLLVSSVLVAAPLGISPRVLAESPTSSQSLALETTHPNGTTLQITNVRFTETAISLNVTAINRSTRKIQLNRFNREMILIDNLGNRYFLQSPETNKYLSMNPGKTSQGWLSFRGGLAPKATSIMLVTNSRMGLKTDPRTEFPLMTVQIPVGQNVVRGQATPPQPRQTASFPWVTPPSFTINGRRIPRPPANFVIQSPNGARLRVRSPNVSSPTTNRPSTNLSNQTQVIGTANRSALSYSEQGLKVQHPNGTVLQVTGVRFGSNRIFVGVNVVNRSPKTIKLNTNPGDLVLIDNLGNQYDIITSVDNPRVEVPPYGTLNGELTFATALDPKATSLTLITNQRSTRSINKNSTAPQFIVTLPLSR